MGKRLSKRQRLEAAIERAIELLNQMDGDEDLEPSLGWTISVPSCLKGSDGRTGFTQVRFCEGAGDDREEEHDGREPDHDEEEWQQAPRAGTGVIAYH